MGRFVNPDNSAFQVALNSDIYVDIVNDKSFFLLSLAAPIFAACKRRFTLQKWCASPGGAIVNGNYFCRLL